MASPVTWAVLLGVSLVLTLVGPFDTDSKLDPVPRAIYWTLIVCLTYCPGALVAELVQAWLDGRPLALIVTLSGVVSGLGASGIVLTARRLVFDEKPGLSEALPFIGTVVAISLIVTAVMFFAKLRMAVPDRRTETRTGTRTDTRATAEARVPLLDRLPLDKRGPLVALSVEDHYVRIQTVKGEDMVLMRLSDAIKEVGPVAGAQVHRSHWVAFGQVTAAQRRGDRAILTLTNGAELPVSRANVPKIREAGLLPK